MIVIDGGDLEVTSEGLGSLPGHGLGCSQGT
jgi:hypothetical protein